MLRKWMGLVILVALAGCTNSKTQASPQKTLSDYVARTFAVKSTSDKSQLVELTTGDVKANLEQLDEQSFKQSFIDSKKEFVSLKIKDERQVAPDRFSITYELTYLDKGQENKDRVTNKKHALFVNEGGKWLIAEVKNIKTFIEEQNDVNIQARKK